MKKYLVYTLISCFFLFFNSQADAQQAEVTKGQFLGKSIPLSETLNLQSVNVAESRTKYKKEWRGIPNFTSQKPMPVLNAENALPKGNDPLMMQSRSRSAAVNGEVPINFVSEGSNQANANVFPPDTDGDNGKNYYIQSINWNGTTVRIYDKQGNEVTSPINLNPLWAEYGAQGLGDPITLYDQEYERWILTEFEGANQNAMLVAVSVTEDPLGEYYAYRFQTPSFPDYPKFGLWNDYITITTNEFSDNFIPNYAFNRHDVMQGLETDFIRMGGMTKFNGNGIFQIASPVEWDGRMAPPADTPPMSLRIHDDGWNGGTDHIEIWEADIDPDNPSASRMVGPQIIELAPFDSHLCNGGIFDCLSQPNVNATFSALQHVLYNRVQYRNFGTHEMMLTNFAIDTDGNNHAGVRWVELRREPGGEWYLYQEGTYSPNDASRFMSSIAMDLKGNIGLVFSIVDRDSTFLGLRVTGRLADDELGEMTFDETSIVEGGNVNLSTRWGDYSSLSIDPTDELTFWFTGEYMQATGGWGTKVASFYLQKNNDDIGPFSLIEPQTGPDLNSTQSVTANIRNFGVETQNLYSVGLMLDGQLIVTDEVDIELAEDSTYLHTFSQTVDMDEIRDYDVKIFTALVSDELMGNDTIDYVVTKLPKYDAGMVKVSGFDALVCSEELEVTAEVRNYGEESLTSFRINADLNGTIESFDYVGELAKGDTYSHVFTLTDFIEGENVLLVTVEQPNGFDDENLDNDNPNTSMFSYSPNFSRMDFDMKTDFYSGETSWILEDQSGNIIAERDYSDGGGIKFDNIFICVEEGCFTFTMKDSYGDGWSSNFGGGDEPFYRWIDNEGNILVELTNKNFGDEEVQEFCIPFECLVAIELSVDDASSPNDADGSIFVDISNAVQPIMYSIDGGVTLQESSSFKDLLPGDYTVYAIDGNGCETTGEVSIGETSPVDDFTNSLDVVIAPNPNEGYFTLQVNGLEDVQIMSVDLLNGNGQILYNRKLVNYSGTHKTDFTLKNYPQGIYYLRLKDQRVKSLFKVVKQ